MADRTSKTKLGHLIEGIIRDVCELPDYNSPDDQPELLQATCSQLEAILRNRLGDETTASAQRLNDAAHGDWLAGAQGLIDACAERRSVEPTPSPVCTCTPSKFEATAWGGTMTSAVIDPNCPLHWRQTLIQNSSPEKAIDPNACSGGKCGPDKDGKQLYCARHWNALPEKASEAWVCPKCQQLNSASATTCGRCDDL